MQHRRENLRRFATFLKRSKIAPRANSSEAPRFEPLRSRISPSVGTWIMLPGRIARVVRIKTFARSTHAHATNTQRKESLSAGPEQPILVVLSLDRKCFPSHGIFPSRRTNHRRGGISGQRSGGHSPNNQSCWEDFSHWAYTSDRMSKQQTSAIERTPCRWLFGYRLYTHARRA